MTNEEAIKELKDASDSEVRYGDIDHHYDEVMKRVEAFDLAIKVLEQQPCEDCISREAVIKHLENITMDTNPDHYGSKDKWYQANGFNLCKVGIEMYVKNLPSVTPKYTDEEIDRAQAVEQAYIDKMVELTVEEWSKDGRK